jgi:ABC-type multidrug transport system permease subunit
MSLLVFPLVFVSSAYVPASTLPGWLRPIAEHQPITYMVDTVRSLSLGDHAAALLGHGTAHYLVPSLIWAAAIAAGFGTLAVARFRRG